MLAILDIIMGPAIMLRYIPPAYLAMPRPLFKLKPLLVVQQKTDADSKK